jgi:hypothetical protein
MKACIFYCELFLLSFCSVLTKFLLSSYLVFTQFLQRYTVSMFLYCEQQWWKGTHFYCEVLLLRFCTEFCASVDSNGGKAHVVSYVYVVDKSVLERHILCFFV